MDDSTNKRSEGNVYALGLFSNYLDPKNLFFNRVSELGKKLPCSVFTTTWSCFDLQLATENRVYYFLGSLRFFGTKDKVKTAKTKTKELMKSLGLVSLTKNDYQALKDSDLGEGFEHMRKYSS